LSAFFFAALLPFPAIFSPALHHKAKHPLSSSHLWLGPFAARETHESLTAWSHLLIPPVTGLPINQQDVLN
jgi:hypothetical protein